MNEVCERRVILVQELKMLHEVSFNTSNRLREDLRGQLGSLEYWVGSGEASQRYRPGTKRDCWQETGDGLLHWTMILKEIHLLSLQPQYLLSWIWKPPFWNNFVMRHNTLSQRIKSNPNACRLPPASGRAINECRLIPSPNGIALSWSSLLRHQLSSGKKITRKIKRQNKPEAAYDMQPGPEITH